MGEVFDWFYKQVETNDEEVITELNTLVTILQFYQQMKERYKNG